MHKNFIGVEQEENGNKKRGVETYALIILLLGDLIDLVQQLSDA